MINSKLSRRSLLGGMFASAFAGSMLGRSRSARAAVTGPAKRLIIFYTAHGTVHDQWTPMGSTPVTGPTSMALGSTLSPILQPIADAGHAGDLLVLDGIDMTSAIRIGGSGTPHQYSPLHALTGAGPMVSIDQTIVNNYGTTTAIPSILASVQAGDGAPGAGASVSWNGSGNNLPGLDSPQDVWNQLFKNFTPPSSGSSPVSSATLQEKAILDFTSNEYNALAASGKLGSLDVARLNTQMQTVKDIDARLNVSAATGCTVPAFPALNQEYHVDADYNGISDAHCQLIASAFACDLTRVASICHGTQPGAAFGLPGITSDVVHSNYAHAYQHGSQTTPPASGGTWNPTTAEAGMVAYHKNHATQFARLITYLKAANVFDDTIVVWCGELSSGDHLFTQWPVVIAGSGGGFLKQGQYMNFANGTPGTSSYSGTPHSNLLVSLCNAFGVDVTTYGDPRYCTGALTQIHA